MSRKKIKAAREPRQTVAPTPPRFLFPVQPFWISLGLVALNLIVYAPVRHFQFVNWDDQSYLTENPNVQAGLSWHNVVWALTTGHSPYWHPVTWLSHMLDVQLFGLDAGPHHVTSLIIHTANTLLLFAVLRRMTGAAGRSAFVAAIFAVHPLHVESVAWLAERKDVLSTFFWLLTIWTYLAYVRRPHWQRYLVVVAVYALALMSKPMVVTLPFFLLLLDIWPLRRVAPGREPRAVRMRVLAEKVPLLGLAVTTGVATLIIQKRVGAVAGLDLLPLHLRVANAAVGYVAYLWKTIWPTRLAAFYPFHMFPPWLVVAAAVSLGGATAVVFRARRRHPYLLVGWLWYVITVGPVIGLMQAGEQAMADRFMYVPMVGLLIMLAWGIPDLVDRIGASGATPAKRVTLAALAVCLVAACALTARAQVQHWSDSVTLWEHAARVSADNYIAHENLGQALRERGQLEEAEVSYFKALAFAPAGSPGYAAVIHNSLGLVLTREGKAAEAIAHFAEAVRLNGGFAEAQSNLGNALAVEGRFPEAIDHYRVAVQIKPDFTEAQVGLGSALLRQGRASEAIPHYQEALRIHPGLAQAHNGLGGALAVEGHEDQAMTEYAEALRLKPDLPTAHFNMAAVLVKQGKTDEARRHLETALLIDPGYQPAREALTRLMGVRR